MTPSLSLTPREPDDDYICMLPCVGNDSYIVVVMHYLRSRDEYVQGRVSRPLSKGAAELLAREWAKHLRIEVR